MHTNFLLKIKAGSKEITPYVKEVIFVSSLYEPLQRIHMKIHMNDEQYTKSVLDFKDSLKIEINVAKNVKSADETIPDIDIGAFDVSILSETYQSTSMINTSNEDVTAPNEKEIICVGKEQFLKIQKMAKNVVLNKVTREDVLKKIFENVPIENVSEVFKPSELLESILIPPMRQYLAFQNIHRKIRLIDGGSPVFVNYCLDNKVYIGSCIKNKLKPLKLYFPATNQDLKKISKALNQKNEYDYLITSEIDLIEDYNVISLVLGNKQNYIFYPMNKLYSRVEKKLEDINKSLFLSNMISKRSQNWKHIKNINQKERWYNKHLGLDIVKSGQENEVLIENFISEHLNQAFKARMTIDGFLKINDFLQIGRKIIVRSELAKKEIDGDWYLSESVITFKNMNMFWGGHVSIELMTSFS